MTDEEWKSLTHTLDDEEIADDIYDAELGEIYSGVLPIGSQGCTYLHALIVSGEYSGRVVNVDMDISKPKFCFENNFLDWYERWLDEIISGILLKDGNVWFGYTMGGDDNKLLGVFNRSGNKQEKLEALYGLNKLISVSDKSCEILLEICSANDKDFKRLAAKLLTKFSYPMATDVLKKLIHGDDEDCLVACQSIFWYARNTSKDWAEMLLQRLPAVNHDETFCFISYILKEAKIDYGNDLIPFCTHESENIRTTAYYSLGLLKNKKEYVNQFILGLSDESPAVVHTTLQALEYVKDPALLNAYKEIIDRFPTDKNYILTNLNYRLEEMGFKGRKDFMRRFGKKPQPSHGLLKKILEYIKR